MTSTVMVRSAETDRGTVPDCSSMYATPARLASTAAITKTMSRTR